MFARVVQQAYRCAIQRANEAISLAILCCGDGGFRLEDGIDASHYSWNQGWLGKQVESGLPRLATSVAISNKKWFLISRLVEVAPSIFVERRWR